MPEHLWNHESMFVTAVVRANEFNPGIRSGGIKEIHFHFLSIYEGIMRVFITIASSRRS